MNREKQASRPNSGVVRSGGNPASNRGRRHWSCKLLMLLKFGVKKSILGSVKLHSVNSYLLPLLVPWRYSLTKSSL
jgi:hypothetical protein